MKILMVCLGNICRSPTAEAVFRKSYPQHFFDSAGTAGYHIGEKSDPRSIRHAEKRGYKMTHLARQLTPQDFHDFDLILVMDHSNYINACQLAPSAIDSQKVKMITDHMSSMQSDKIPDPYYESAEVFEHVIDLLEDCAQGWNSILRDKN